MSIEPESEIAGYRARGVDAESDGQIKIASVLSVLHEVFSSVGLNYWLDAGSLLKFTRGGDIYPSSDLDIACWYDDIHLALQAVELLKARGFTCQAQGGLHFVEDLFQLYFPEEWDIPLSHIDLYLYRRHGHEAVRRNIHKPIRHGRLSIFLFSVYFKLFVAQPEAPSPLQRVVRKLDRAVFHCLNKTVFALYAAFASTIWYVVPRSLIESMQTAILYDVPIAVPTDSVGYLNHRYSETWRSPNKGWRVCDGGLVRFRRLWVRGFNITSEVFLPWPKIDRPSGEPTRVFDFSAEEIEKIEKLDG